MARLEYVKCDRCDKTIASPSEEGCGIVLSPRTGDRIPQPIDLCGDCLKVFNSFMQAIREEKKRISAIILDR